MLGEDQVKVTFADVAGVEEAKQELGGEVIDVIFAAMCIANKHNIDLDEEFRKKMEKCTERDSKRFAKK